MKSLLSKFEEKSLESMKRLAKELSTDYDILLPSSLIRRATKVRKTRRTRKNCLKR